MKPAWCTAFLEWLELAREVLGETGADASAYQPAPVLSPGEVAAFELRHGVSLPEDYAAFVQSIGDGGIGPDYGIGALAVWSPEALPQVTTRITTTSGEQFEAGTGARPPLARPAELSKPFLVNDRWDPVDANGQPTDLPVPADANPYDGCLQLAEIGCGYFHFLVATGERRGQMWVDYTAGDGSMAVNAASFREWIGGWLAGALTAVLGQAAVGALESGEVSEPLRALLGRGCEVLIGFEADGVGEREQVLSALAFSQVCGGRLGLADETRERLEAHDPNYGWLPTLRKHLAADDLAGATAEPPTGDVLALARHRFEEVRHGLASNPQAPRAALAVLATDEELGVRFAVAAHPAADGDLLAAMVDSVLASWDERGVEPDGCFVLELVARNPRAPSALIARVGAAALARPDQRLTAAVLRGVALAPNAPAPLIEALAVHGWPEVRHAVARSESATSQQLIELAADADPAVRAACARRPDVPEACLVALTDDRCEPVVAAAAANPSTPEAALRGVLERQGPSIPYALEERGGLSPELTALVAMHPDSEESPRAPVEARDERDVDRRSSSCPAVEAVSAGKVRHWSFPVALLGDFLAGHMATYEMAHRPWLPAGLYAVLAADEYAYTRAGIAERVDTPSEIMRQLADDPSEIVRGAVARNPSVPKDVLARLLQDATPSVVGYAAAHPNSPPELVGALTTHSEMIVRYGTAGSPHVGGEALERLAADPSERVRRVVVRRAELSRPALVALSADPDDDTRGIAALQLALRAAREGRM